MPKRQKRLTRGERQALHGKGPSGTPKQPTSQHIHCISCGRHIEPNEITRATPGATWLTCQHGSRFAACAPCVIDAQQRLDEHDRTGDPPRIAAVWH